MSDHYGCACTTQNLNENEEMQFRLDDFFNSKYNIFLNARK